jgi:hypothetical protein
MLGEVINVTWSSTMYELSMSTEWVWLRGVGLDVGGSYVYIWYRIRI